MNKKYFTVFILILLLFFAPLGFAWCSGTDCNTDWAYYQELTLNTSGLLSADINNDHAILVHVDSSNTDFWSNNNVENKVDNFEDGDYTRNPVWTPTPNLDGAVSIESTITHSGDYSMKLYGGSSGPAYIFSLTPFTPTGTVDEFSAWVYVTTDQRYDLTMQRNSDSEARILFNLDDGNFNWHNGSDWIQIGTYTYNEDEWVQIKIFHDSDTTDATYEAYDQNGTLIFSSALGIKNAAVTIEKMGFSNPAFSIWYLDDIVYNKEKVIADLRFTDPDKEGSSDTNIFEGFESGDYNHDQRWEIVSGFWDNNTGIVHSGTYSLKGGTGTPGPNLIAHEFLNSINSNGFTLSWWGNVNAFSTSQNNYLVLKFGDANNGVNSNSITTSLEGTGAGTGKGHITRYVNGVNTEIGDINTLAQGNWYKYVFTINSGVGVATLYNASDENMGGLVFTVPSGNITKILLRTEKDALFDDINWTGANLQDLPYHFEDVNTDTNTALTWVRIPTFDADSNTTIKMYYGNSDANNFQNEAGTYPSGYETAYHMDTPTTNLIDSTGHHADATVNTTPTVIDGKIGIGARYDGTDDYHTEDFRWTGTDTVSETFWVKDENPGEDEIIGQYTDASAGYFYYISAGNKFVYYLTNGSVYNVTSTSDVNINKWQQVTGTYDGSNIKIYVDGIEEDSDSMTGNVVANNDFKIGGRSGASSDYEGQLDELKHYNYALDSNEISLLYNSENTSLLSFGTQTSQTGKNYDINIISPISLQVFSIGNNNIDFNIIDVNSEFRPIDINLAYSTVSGEFQNLIYYDSNLADGVGITCSNYLFTTTSTCTYIWNTTGISIGNYYIDINSYDTNTNIEELSAQFSIQDSVTLSYIDGNGAPWKNYDFNIVFVDLNFGVSGGYDKNYSATNSGATLTTGKSGGANEAYEFDMNNYINLGDLDINSDITFASWIYFSGDDFQEIFTKNSSYRSRIERLTDSHYYMNRFYFEDATSTPEIQLFPVPKNEWVFLATTYNSTTGEIIQYLNKVGYLYGTTYVGKQLKQNSEDLTLSGPGYNETLYGKIDNAVIYSSALNEADINAIYDNGVTAHDNLVAYYPLSSTFTSGTSIAHTTFTSLSKYRIDSGAWQTFGNDINNWIVDNNYYVLIEDQNHTIDYNFVNAADFNLVGTVLGLYDDTNAVVGTTTIAGFDTYTTFFKGTGTIYGGTATDTNSDINQLSCQYIDTNGGSWATADWNNGSTLCQKSSWTGINGLSYNFNTKVDDNASNVGYGTITSTYTFDTNGPQTTMDSNTQASPATADMNVVLSCTDANAGCYKIWYNVDSGTWQSSTDDTNWFTVTTAGRHLISFFSQDNLDNNETQQDINIYIAGRLRLRVADENTGLYLDNVSVNFNSTDYNIVNPLDLNLYGLTDGDYTLTFTKSDYGTRTYTFDLNQYGNFDVNMLLLPSSLGLSTGFKFYARDESSLLSNYYIGMVDNDKNGWSIGRLKVNGVAEGTYFINLTDQNYNQIVTNTAGDSNTYTPMVLTVSKPKDEITLLDINVTHYIEITVLASLANYNLAASQKYTLLPNTISSYVFKIQDQNRTDYYQKTYSINWKGDTNTDTLQPYLLPAGFGSQIIFVIENEVKNVIPDVIVKIYKTIGGSKTLYTSGTSNNYGEVLFYLSTTETYSIELYRDGNLVYSTDNFTVTAAKVTFQVATRQTSVTPVLNKNIRIVWLPGQESLLDIDTNLAQKVYGEDANHYRMIVYQYVTDNNYFSDRNITRDINGSCSGGCTTSILYADLNIIEGKTFFIDYNVYVDDINYFSQTKRYIKYASGSFNLYQLILNSRTNFDQSCSTNPLEPCGLTIIISIVIAIFAIIFSIYKMDYVSKGGTILIALGILGIFTLVGWFFWMLYAILVVASLIGYLGKVVVD